MKKNVLTLLIALAITTGARAQLEYTRSYYKLTTQDGSNYVLDHKTENSNILNYPTYHGGRNQQWAVMPLFVMRKDGIIQTDPAREFIIATRHNGRVVDISGSADLHCYWPFHGGNNQIYKLNTTGVAQVYTISSPKDVNRVIQRYYPFADAVFYPVSSPPTSRQKYSVVASHVMPYYFTTLANKRTTAIPFPSAPTSFSQVMATETPMTFIQEVLIPYPFVKNDLAYGIQIDNSPYYKMVHKQYYRRAAGNWDVVFLKNGEYTHSIQIKNGMVQSQVTEVTSKLDLSFSSTGEVNFTIAGVGLKLSNTLAAAFSRSVKQVTSWQETYEKTESYSTTLRTGALDRRVVTYQLVDYYELYRANEQSTPALRWEVGRNESVQLIYEGDSSGGGRIAGGENSTTEYLLVDGQMIPKSKPANLVRFPENALNIGRTNQDVRLLAQGFSVFPNPSRDLYTVTVTPGIYSSFNVLVYNEAGKLVYEDHKTKTFVDQTIVALNDLPRGQYILKVVTDQGEHVERIVKE